MLDAVQIKFTWTEKEYASALRLYYAHKTQTRFLLILSFVVLVIGAAAALLTAELLGGAFMLALGSAFLSYFYWIYYLLPKQHYRQNKSLREEYYLEFSNQGYHGRCDGAESKMEWKRFVNVWETNDFYFLFYDRNLFTFVPKNAFESEAQEATFRTLLRNNVCETFETKQRLIEKVEKQPNKTDYKLPSSPPDWR